MIAVEVAGEKYLILREPLVTPDPYSPKFSATLARISRKKVEVSNQFGQD